MNESEQRAWASHLDASLPPPIPPADRLMDRARVALQMLQELEIELGNRPDLVEFARQITDAVSMVGRLQDHLDYPAEDDAEEPEEVSHDEFRMG